MGGIRGTASQSDACHGRWDWGVQASLRDARVFDRRTRGLKSTATLGASLREAFPTPPSTAVQNLICARLAKAARRGLVFLPARGHPPGMKSDVVPVEIRGIVPGSSGCSIFVGNDEKVFVIQVEHNMGAVIGMFLREAPKERPLTHDLVNNIFKGFNIALERVVITELKNSTYFARLILQQNNELGRKLVELDARPSDCLALATAQKKPLFVTAELFEQVEDMSKWLEEINENSKEDE
jgi:hypothetical protein